MSVRKNYLQDIRNPGTGEHIDNLELFEEKTFVSKLLGMGDIQASCHLLICMSVSFIFTVKIIV
jgi:signal recognition particle GTPase